MRTTYIITTLTGAALALVLSNGASAQDDKVSFEKDIYPLVKNSCLDCHKPPYEDERGRTRKPKGDLVLVSKEGFEAGGEDGAIIEAGKPEDSPFYAMTILPIEHDEHMPPEGKADEWTDDQKALVKKWIEQGADYGDWVIDPDFKE